MADVLIHLFGNAVEVATERHPMPWQGWANHSGRTPVLWESDTMDVLVLLIVTVFGVLGGPTFVVLVGAATLTLMSARRKIEIARTYPDIGTSRVLVGALFLSFVN